MGFWPLSPVLRRGMWLISAAGAGGPCASRFGKTGKLADPWRSSISICKLHLLSMSRVPPRPRRRRAWQGGGRCCRCYCMAVWNINATEPALWVPALIKNRAEREGQKKEELGALPACNDVNLCSHPYLYTSWPERPFFPRKTDSSWRADDIWGGPATGSHRFILPYSFVLFKIL